MSRVARSWSSMTRARAAEYMRGYGHPAESSKVLLREVLLRHFEHRAAILELGCGNGQLFEFLRAGGLNGRYLGVDFSQPLLQVARERYGGDGNATFIEGDVCQLPSLPANFDVIVYSHVIEMLESPERSLIAAGRLGRSIVIRFFEPPEHDTDLVELREMDVGDGTSVPYLRRSMGSQYYRLILSRLGCRSVDVYHDDESRDQVHVLRLNI